MNTVYGVVVSTKEGSSYGLRHVENIWKKTKLAWSTGFVTESHGNTLDSKDYAAMMGQTINKVTYYTNQGIYEIPMDQQVAKKFDGEVSVADVSVKSDKTSITVSGLQMILKKNTKLMESMKMHILLRSKQMARLLQEQLNSKKALTKVDIPLHLAIGMANYVPISTTFNALYRDNAGENIMKIIKNQQLVKNDNVNEEEFQTYLKILILLQ